MFGIRKRYRSLLPFYVLGISFVCFSLLKLNFDISIFYETVIDFNIYKEVLISLVFFFVGLFFFWWGSLKKEENGDIPNYSKKKKFKQIDEVQNIFGELEEAKTKWIKASEDASKLKEELLKIAGYGCPYTKEMDKLHFQISNDEAERLFREYSGIWERSVELKVLKVQKSQHLASWASFTVAAVVGFATIVNMLVTYFK